MIKYPIYALRRYDFMEEIDGIVYMNTYHNRYVLDDKNIESDNYLERRVVMLTKEYDAKLYPLKYKCDSVIQINKIYRSNKYKTFIDATGRLGTYTPSENVRVEWKKCTNIPSADGMFYAAVVKGEPYHFVTKEPYLYLGIITYNGGRYIYDVSNTKPEKEVMWRKI